VLAVGTCAYLAAVFLCADARRERDQVLTDQFRFRAVTTAAVVGAVSLAGVLVLRSDAPRLYDGLLGRALPCLVLSVLAGLASLGLLVTRRFVAARITATAAVAAVVWGWALAQYPYMLIPGLTIEQAAAHPVSLQALLIVLLGGSVLLAPALIYMYALFQRAVPHTPDGQDTRSRRRAA
jgi:cytochrome d ubiquinol oxidase subunit II